jgi:hypothetical protein
MFKDNMNWPKNLQTNSIAHRKTNTIMPFDRYKLIIASLVSCEYFSLNLVQLSYLYYELLLMLRTMWVFILLLAVFYHKAYQNKLKKYVYRSSRP